MKISNNKIHEIIEDCKLSGYNVKVRDISFILLCRWFEDTTLAYKSVFGVDADEKEVSEYTGLKAISFLKRYIDSNYPENVSYGVKNDKSNDISFGENKEYMLKLKRDTETAMENGEIDKKDGLKILTDISVKLNDKFNVQEEVKDQLVIVQAKYNSVCDRCGAELYIPTKADLMKKYNLIEKETKK